MTRTSYNDMSPTLRDEYAGSRQSPQNYGIQIMGQNAGLYTYGQILLTFPLSPEVSQAETLRDLNAAAAELYQRIPRLSGAVILAEDHKHRWDKFTIVPFEPHRGPTPVRSRDCTGTYPSYEQLATAHFPCSMIPDDVVNGLKSAPMNYVGTPDPIPVLVITANFISGGLMLAFSLQHNAGDATGFGIVIEHFATLLRGEPLSPTMIAAANSEHASTIPLLHPGEQSTLSGAASASRDTLAKKREAGTAGYRANWVCFHLAAAKLAELKVAATPPKPDWISTNDALTAFIWRRLTAVRSARAASEALTVCLRAVNTRAKFESQLPEGFLGCVVRIVQTVLPVQKVLDQPLASTAVMLRSTATRVTDHDLRSHATFWTEKPEESPVEPSATAGVDQSLGVGMVSWADLKALRVRFGRLGLATFARRVGKVPLDGFCYPMPKTADGSTDLLVCLSDEDLMALRDDQEWARYAEYVG